MGGEPVAEGDQVEEGSCGEDAGLLVGLVGGVCEGEVGRRGEGESGDLEVEQPGDYLGEVASETHLLQSTDRGRSGKVNLFL